MKVLTSEYHDIKRWYVWKKEAEFPKPTTTVIITKMMIITAMIPSATHPPAAIASAISSTVAATAFAAAAIAFAAAFAASAAAFLHA